MMKKIMPTTWLLVSLLAMVVLHMLVPIFTVNTYAWKMLGLIPLGVGIYLNIDADRSFKQAKTTVKPFQESSVLVTSGVFRITRNPMYLGFMLVLLGIAFLLGTLSPWLVILAFYVLMERVYILVEEQMLAEKFGSQWEGYQKRTRRWF